MTNRMKQLGLTIGLAAPLAISALTSGPFTASTSAQDPSQQGMVGPNSPILIDVDNNGPSAGDAQATPQQSGTQLQVPKQFSCQSQQNTAITLGGTDSAGHFTSFSRNNDFRFQTLGVTNCAGGTATGFVYTEVDPRGIRAQGTGTFVDTNADGQADTFMVSGNVSAMVNLVFTPNNKYVSIPLSQQALLGGATARCGITTVPQIWVPLADTDRDGRGDSVVFDLNGDGVPDPQFCKSPKLAGIGVPATSNVALAILTILLGSMGVWLIGRRGPTLPTARSL
jgi:hypothetical protein